MAEPVEQGEINWSVKEVLYRVMPYWWWRWLYMPLQCKRDKHVQSNDSWGFGGAVIDWYCANCDRRIGFTALDDASDELLQELQDSWGGPMPTIGFPEVEEE